MSIKDIIKKEEVKPTVIYTSVKGCCSSKGGLMPKVGEIFLNPCKEDIEILEYFVSIGIVGKTNRLAIEEAEG